MIYKYSSLKSMIFTNHENKFKKLNGYVTEVNVKATPPYFKLFFLYNNLVPHRLEKYFTYFPPFKYSSPFRKKISGALSLGPAWSEQYSSGDIQ